mmetsp:Transcript_8691/g.10221  ORF Transcript_8691/g.10221 Transcript_8691/m.10221 type:complete len:108 (-) Transcript_8691:1333-1656(-)
MDCFDCAYTAGKCVYDPQRSRCVDRPPNFDIDGLRWWQWFEYCEDTLGLCSSTNGSIRKINSQQMSASLANEDELSFSMTRPLKGASKIPENYFCRWQIEINKKSQY